MNFHVIKLNDDDNDELEEFRNEYRWDDENNLLKFEHLSHFNSTNYIYSNCDMNFGDIKINSNSKFMFWVNGENQVVLSYKSSPEIIYLVLNQQFVIENFHQPKVTI